MIVRFVEAMGGPLYGKFLVARMEAVELMTPSAMPDAAYGERLLTHAGRRRFNDHSTLVTDLQRGTAFAWPLDGGGPGMYHYAREHFGGIEMLVCPLYLPFVHWLHVQGKWAMGRGDITEIPCYLDLDQVVPAPSAE